MSQVRANDSTKNPHENPGGAVDSTQILAGDSWQVLQEVQSPFA
jgi:hypothetical protein